MKAEKAQLDVPKQRLELEFKVASLEVDRKAVGLKLRLGDLQK
jgi:hypothetical protein